MFTSRKIWTWLQTTAIVFFVVPVGSSTVLAAEQQPISVLVEPTRDSEKMVYRVNSQEVAFPNLLEKFDKLAESRDKSTPVMVIVHGSVSIATLSNIRGIIQKVGFANIRYFYFGDHKTMMAEILINRPAVPFSLRGPRQ